MIIGKVIRDFRQPKTFVDVYIQTLKKDKDDFKVIDVGGGINSWCQHTTHVVDIFVNPGSKEEFKDLLSADFTFPDILYFYPLVAVGQLPVELVQEQFQEVLLLLE